MINKVALDNLEHLPHAVRHSLIDVLTLILRRMEIVGVVIIGSALFSWSFVYKKSDIDLVLLVDGEVNINRTKVQMLAAIAELAGIFLTEPKEVCSYQSRRIETKFYFGDIRIDIAIAPVQVKFGEHHNEILIDNLELYLGNLYAHGILLAGNRPKIQGVSQIHPYLNDRIRSVRMQAIQNFINKQRSMTSRLNMSSLPQFLRLQFLAQRVYPISLTKHLLSQAKHLLVNDTQIHLTNRLIDALSNDNTENTIYHQTITDFLKGAVSET